MIDLLIAGAGPAGLATALYATRAGLEVTVVDPRADSLDDVGAAGVRASADVLASAGGSGSADGFGRANGAGSSRAAGSPDILAAAALRPIDKACGEGLMPGAVAALRALGVDPPGRPFLGIGYVDGDHRAEAYFRSGPGVGARRTDLHSALVTAVRAAGVSVLPRSVGALRQDGAAITAAGVTARYLVAADGLHSPIARSLGLDVPVRGARPRWGLRRHFRVAPWSDLVEVHWSSRAEAYVTPVGPELVGVALLSGDRAPFGEQLARFPALVERVGAAEGGAVRGAGPLRRRTSRRVADRVLLVGDAAGYVDALTGEGIAVSLACARSLVECVVAGRPAEYEARWLRESRRYRAITSSLLWASGRPAVRRALVPAAQRVPWVFRAAVGQLAR